MSEQTGLLPTLVEILTRSGWSVAGFYSSDRADQIVELLVAEGAVARQGGSLVTDTRLVWEPTNPYAPDAWTGVAYGDMRLFTLTCVEPPDPWLLRSAVPGDTGSVRRFDTEVAATDAAERVLIAFLDRVSKL